MSDTAIATDDLPTLLAKREHARPNKLTWILITLLVLAAGFVGGVIASQKVGPASSPMTFSGPPAGFSPPSGSSVTVPAVNAGTETAGTETAGNSTVGTVKLVDGRNLYIATTDGSVVKVTVPASASVTTQNEISLQDIASGATVAVQGKTDDDGGFTATTITRQPTTQGAN